MKLLPILLFVCFVVYEVLQVEGKSKQDAVKKLLQKYIHHHKHHHVHHHHSHHHKHHHHHHHHHKHHHHHHKHRHHHHHRPHHKSFHQKLVEKLRKEKQKQHHQQNVVKATKRESLPQLLVSLGKGFMQLGKNLGKNESHPDAPAAMTSTIKHAPTPKHLVYDHVATTQAARPFATPSPTSEYYGENNDSDDIGGDALTPAPPTPLTSQKFMSSSDTPQSSKQDKERLKHRHENDSPMITPTPQSGPSPSPNPRATVDDIPTTLDHNSPRSRKQGRRMPQHKNADSPFVTPTRQYEPRSSRFSPNPIPSPKAQAIPDDFSSSQSDDKEKPLNLTLDSSKQDITVKSKIASDSDKENESLSSKDGLDRAKGIDKHGDSSEPKIPEVKREESVPNPSIEIPAARLLEPHSPTESVIDGREDESFHSEQENQFANSTLSENSNPNLFVAEPRIDEESPGRVEMNATQSIDQVVKEPGLQNDLSSIDGTKGSSAVSTAEAPTEDVPVPDSIDKLQGYQSKGAAQPTSQDEAQFAETKAEDSQSHENSGGDLSVANERSLNTEPKETKSTASSDEIMDGEVSPSEIIAENVDDLNSRSSTLSPTAARLKPSTAPEPSESDINTHKATTVTESQYSESTLDGTTPSMSQDAEHTVANQASLETSSNVDGTNGAVSSSSVDDITVKATPKESDSTTDQLKTESQATSSSVDDITVKTNPKESDSTTDQLKTESQATSSSVDDITVKTNPKESDSTTDQLKTESQATSSSVDGITVKTNPKESDSTTDQLKTESQATSSSVDGITVKTNPKESDSTTDQLKTESQATSSSVDDITVKTNPKESDSTTDQLKTESQATSSSDDNDSAEAPLYEDNTTNQMEAPQPTTQSKSATKSLLAESDSTAHQMDSSIPSAQPGGTEEELAQSSNQESDSTSTDAEAQSVQASSHGGDDIMVGATKQPSHDVEALKDGSGASEDATSDLDDGKTGAEVTNSQFPNEHNKSSQEAAVTSVVSNSEQPTHDVPTQPNPQPKSSETPSQRGDRSDDLRSATHQAPVYQNYTNFDSQENDGAAQLSEVPIDESYVPTLARLADDTTRDEENPKVTNRVVNSFPSEIEDGEVLPPNTPL